MKKNLLIIRPDSIGDWVLFTGILPQLKILFPKHDFHLVIQERISELAQLHFRKENIHAFGDRHTLLHDRAVLIRYVERLNLIPFDQLIYPVFSRCILGDLLCRSIKAGRKTTFKGDTSNQIAEILETNNSTYDVLAEVPKTVTREIDRYPYLLKAMGGRLKKESHPELRIPNSVLSKVKKSIQQEMGDTPFLVLSPFPQLPIRSWPMEKWVDLVRALNPYGLIVTGSDSQSKMAQQLIRKSRHPLIMNACGKTSLLDLCAMIQLARLHIGVESSASQIAPAVKTHTVVILGGGHFDRFVPYSRYHHAVYHKLPCYHCNWHCPYKAPYCITDISIVEVLNELKKCNLHLEAVKSKRTDSLPYKYYQYGSLNKALKHVETSITYFKKVLENKIHYKARCGAFFHLGELYLAKGETKQALDYFEKCLRRMPNHEAAKNHFNRLTQKN